MALRIVFRNDIEWMAAIMGVPLRRLKMIVENDWPSTDMDMLVCEMACSEQAEYVERRLKAIRSHMAKAK
jgi:hypothetical protein